MQPAKRCRVLRAFAVAFIAIFWPLTASAEDLTIGLSAAPTSIDPHFYVIGPNSAMARNIFDGLVNQNEKQQIEPALAQSWARLEDTVWEFTLRADVKFHDGSLLTADDVVASIKRVSLAAQNSPSSFVPYVRSIKEITALAPLKVRIVTDGVAPLLLNNLSRIAIMPAKQGATTTEAMNQGMGVIGTGPFRFLSWMPEDRVILERHNDYWGAPPVWDKVTFRIFKNNSARVAALLSGDVDMIENIPTPDLPRLSRSDRVKVVKATGNRLMYLHMDQDRETSPFAHDGTEKNPLLEPAMRQALSLSIDRQALIDRVMDGQGTPTGQFVPVGYFGYNPAIPLDPYDPEKAKQLLAQLSQSQDFSLTFHASNDRYPNDAKIAQVIGQFFSRIGIKTDVVTLPGSVYFSRASAREFSLIMGGAAVETGEASGILGPLLESYGENAGQGNRGRYSNAEFDRLLNLARQTLDEGERQRLLQQASLIAATDRGIIPLFFLDNSWALRSGLHYKGRSDGYTLAVDVTVE